MYKKYLVLVLTVLVINLTFNAPTSASVSEPKEAKIARKLKREIIKLGSGTEAKIEVKLKDGTKLKGYVGGIADDYFTVVDENTNDVTPVPYSNAKQVKGNNLSTGVTIALVIVAIAVIGVIGSILFAQ